MAITEAAAGEAFLKQSLTQLYGVEVSSIAVLEYDPGCPFPYNNFIYDIHFAPLGQAYGLPVPDKPGTTPLPRGTKQAIGRLANPAAGLVQQNRIENEAAAMALAREALRSRSLSHLVPDVYHWQSAASDAQGWILMEHKPGVQVATVLETLDDAAKESVVMQMATVVAAVQQSEMPKTVQAYGGLSFDSHGDIVSGPMTTLPIAPMQYPLDFVRARLRSQFKSGQKHGILNGENDATCERLEALLESELSEALGGTPKLTKQTLVHGDYSTTNLLVDPETHQLTALLDFDFAYIGFRLDGFYSFMSDLHGQLVGPVGAEKAPGQRSIKRAILSGEWSPREPLSSDSDVKTWELARLWYKHLAVAGADVPSTMAGTEPMSALYELSELLCPFLVCNRVVSSRRSEEQRAKDVENAEWAVSRALAGLGY